MICFTEINVDLATITPYDSDLFSSLGLRGYLISYLDLIFSKKMSIDKLLGVW